MKKKRDFFVITIDGPAGAGKSTIAKIVADRLGICYIDTGAMYRAVTYKVMKERVDFKDADKIVTLAKNSAIEFKDGKIFLDGADVSEKIRTRAVTNYTSAVAAIGEVRKILRNFQRQYAREKSIVMEGRDIGTVVFPNAKYKFYLDASLTERAKRRFMELRQKGSNISLEEVIADINRRDNIDLNRGLCPLKIPSGAVVIDSTNKSIEEVAEIIIGYVKKNR
ncbi:MAG: (d)CMP kinase [Elusimicrobia bacterium]|nr:(d)CMP kinase [Elusimicrobiota bacterium]